MTKESNTKQKRIFRGAVAAAAVLMFAAVLFVGAGAAVPTVVTTEAELQDALNLTSAEIQLGDNIDLTKCLIFGDGTTANSSTLDLNGHVLYQTTDHTRVLVIKKEASLRLTDSNPSAQHVFSFNRTAAWDYMPAETTGISIDAITDSTADGTFIIVPGGVITSVSREMNEITGVDQRGGGAVLVTGNLVMDSGTFAGCADMSSTLGRGGAILVGNGVDTTSDASSLVLNGTAQFIGCAGRFGGAIILDSTSVTGLVLEDSATIRYCYATSQGGAIQISLGTFTMTGGEITHCSADYGGCVISWGSFTMSGGEIADCSAKYGGCVYVNSGTFTMSGGEIADCSAKYGGCVYVRKSAMFTMSGGEITHCSATLYGGCVENHGTFTMTGGEITHCSATLYGGCVENHGTFTMTGGRIAYCVAYNGPDDGQGGAMDLQEGITHISGTAVIEHCSANWGGAIEVINKAIVYIEGGTFRNNKAYLTGGALGVGNGKCWVSGGIFENNTALYGGAVDAGCGSTIITGGIFRDNHDDSGSNAIATEQREGGYYFPNLIIGGTVTLEGDQSFRLVDISKEPNAFKIGTPTTIDATAFTDEKFTGSIKNFIIDNDDLDGRTLFEIKSGQNASDVLGRLGLQDTDKWTLTADDTSDPKKIVIQLNKPAVSSVYYDWNNDGTAVNVSVALTDANDADSAKVLFYNATDYAYFTVTNTDTAARKPTYNKKLIWKLTDDPTGAVDGTTTKTLAAGATGTYYLSLDKAYFTVKDATGNLTYLASPTAQQKAAASVNPENYAYLADISTIGSVVTFTPLNTKVGTAAGSSFAKGSIISDINVENLVPANPYTVKVVLENSDLSVNNFGYNFGVVTYEAGLPTISEHPQSAACLKDAETEALQVTAAGTSLEYQWENSTDGTTFTAMPGETFDNITPSTAELGTVYYRVKVTDTANSKSVYSLTAEIEVYSTYSITYNPKEGSLPATGNPSQYSSNEALALNDPVRQYYVGSWINAATNEPVSDIYKGTTGDLTLNAAYAPREYAITYNNGGQTTNPATYNVTSGTIILTDAARAGYLFLGWYNNAAFTGAKVTSISSAAPKDIEVYGRWVQQLTKVVTADSNVSFSKFEGTANPRTVGTQTVLTGIDGLTPGKNISFAKARPDISSSTLPSQSGYYTNVYSVFDIGYDGIMSGEAQITLNVTLAAGDSADSLHAMHNDGSGWTDLINVSKTQTGNKVTIVGNTSSFSPFAILSYSAQQQPSSSHSSSRNDGYSVWLTATPTPVPTNAVPTAEPTQAAPVASPVKPQPTQTSSSPAPLLGILAGLGAAAVLFGLRRT